MVKNPLHSCSWALGFFLNVCASDSSWPQRLQLAKEVIAHSGGPHLGGFAPWVTFIKVWKHVLLSQVGSRSSWARRLGQNVSSAWADKCLHTFSKRCVLGRGVHHAMTCRKLPLGSTSGGALPASLSWWLI